MREFREYSPEDVILSNLRENTRRADLLREQEIAHLQELAAEIASVGDLQEILAILPDRRPQLAGVQEETLPQNADTVGALHVFSRAQRAVLLCSALRDLLTLRGILSLDAFFLDTEPIRDTAHARIVYPKSGYSDSAYLAVSSLFEESYATYTHSFISACEEVYNGLCEYCILPLENSTEGVLASFLRLIARYDLKIAATCEVPSHGEGKLTRFALLRKNLISPMGEWTSERRFSLLLPYSPSGELAELLGAADFFGLKLLTLTLLPGERAEEHALLYLSFYTPENLEGFLLYLAMELPHSVSLGFYPNIKKKGKA